MKSQGTALRCGISCNHYAYRTRSTEQGLLRLSLQDLRGATTSQIFFAMLKTEFLRCDRGIWARQALRSNQTLYHLPPPTTNSHQAVYREPQDIINFSEQPDFFANLLEVTCPSRSLDCCCHSRSSLVTQGWPNWSKRMYLSVLPRTTMSLEGDFEPNPSLKM